MIKYVWSALLGLALLIAGTSVAWLLATGKVFGNRSDDPCQSIHFKNLPASTSQLVIVNPNGGIKAQISACQRQGASWKPALNSSFPAVIGREGIAALGEKKEGDMKTPAGLYPLGEAFGTQPLALKMDYKYITVDDKFVDDVKHKDYNSWVNGATDAKSFETMLIKPYKMGLVINYNMNPTIPGAGSAIFMHLWESENVPTVGCVATDEPHLSALLNWLDKQQQPYIYISPQQNPVLSSR